MRRFGVLVRGGNLDIEALEKTAMYKSRIAAWDTSFPLDSERTSPAHNLTMDF